MGQDNQFQPVIVIKIAALELNRDKRFDALDALTFCFIVARKFLCRPGYIEQCSLIVDMQGVGLLDFPVQEIKYLGEQLFKHFPCFVDRLYICNIAETVRMFTKIFNSTLGLLVATNTDYFVLVDKRQDIEIPVTQLLRRFGGALPDPEHYW